MRWIPVAVAGVLAAWAAGAWAMRDEAGPYGFVRAPLFWAGLVAALTTPWALAGAAAGLGMDALRVRRTGAAYRVRVRWFRPRLRPWRREREAAEPPVSAPRTEPPGHAVVLYDGECRFCTAQSKNLLRLAAPGAIEAVSFQDPGVLERFPGVTHAACMRAMHLITADGRVFAGFEAAVKAVSTRRWLAPLAHAYYLPGIRLLCDAAYALAARNRYRLAGRAVARGECDGGSCGLHFKKP